MEWIELKNNNGIKELMEIFGGFHDSCLKESYMWTESFVDEELSMHMSFDHDTNVRILLQRQYENPSAIELLFEGVTQFHIIPHSINYDSIIYGAALILRDGLFYWAGSDDWVYEEKDRFLHTSWISSERLKWRDVCSRRGNKADMV